MLGLLPWLTSCGSAADTGGTSLASAAPVGETSRAVASNPYVVIGWNDLGMHCMNQDFSNLMILPPYNTLHAQVIRRGEEPQIVSSGVTVSYSVPGNTRSSTKTNFWQYAKALTGLTLANDVGLTGHKLAGTMTATSNRDWSVTGVPITPVTDVGALNAYQMASISVASRGTTVANTQAVIPVSWEISCNLCHNTPGISPDVDILRKHDSLHGTQLVKQRPVNCALCHAEPNLGSTGAPGVKSLSAAMHGSHAKRMASAKLTNECYACHPGVKTNCQRDVHKAKGITCTACHGSMANVAAPSRRPWVDEPSCGGCHKRAGFEFEQPGTLFRNSKGHHGVQCAACHGSPHAVGPAVNAADNAQAIALQGHAGPIDTCTVCHTKRPDEAFEHRLDD